MRCLIKSVVGTPVPHEADVGALRHVSPKSDIVKLFCLDQKACLSSRLFQ